MTPDPFNVRSVIIESAAGNAGELYIADSESNAGTVNRHVLYGPGDVFSLNGSQYADLDALINLNELWVHGSVVGDRFVISFQDINVEVC